MLSRSGVLARLVDRVDLFLRQSAILARLQCRVQHDGTHAFTVQCHHLVTDCMEHPFDLMVAPFIDGQPGFAGAQSLQFCGRKVVTR